MRIISFSPPDIDDADIDEVVKVLKSGWITTGPKTKEFEKEIAEYCHTEKAVCLNSATACMELTLRILGIGNGDEVITSAYTYTASASVICHVGAKPVLIDTAKDSYEMDYEQLSKAITPRTKAVIAVDIAGVMCDYDRIMEITNEKSDFFISSNGLQKSMGRIAVIADAAHSLGAIYKGKPNGSMADFTCFSFHAVKNITTGEGGAVTWKKINGINPDDLYREYMLLSLHGQSKDALAKAQLGAWEYDIVEIGYKCNMTDIMAALGVSQLRRYRDILSRRHRIINIYNEGLKNLPVRILTHQNDDYISSGHLYLARLSEKDSDYRDKIIRQMSENGIACNVHFKPLPMHTAYKKLGFDIKDFPNAYETFQNEITLPLHTGLKDDDVHYIIKNMHKAIANN